MEAAALLFHGVEDTREQEKALAALGFRPEEPIKRPGLEVWEENWPAVRVFMSASTQWVRDFNGGLAGLRYESLPLMLEVEGVARDNWPQVVADVQVMERHCMTLAQKK